MVRGTQRRENVGNTKHSRTENITILTCTYILLIDGGPSINHPRYQKWNLFTNLLASGWATSSWRSSLVNSFYNPFITESNVMYLSVEAGASGLFMNTIELYRCLCSRNVSGPSVMKIWGGKLFGSTGEKIITASSTNWNHQSTACSHFSSFFFFNFFKSLFPKYFTSLEVPCPFLFKIYKWFKKTKWRKPKAKTHKSVNIIYSHFPNSKRPLCLGTFNGSRSPPLRDFLKELPPLCEEQPIF